MEKTNVQIEFSEFKANHVYALPIEDITFELAKGIERVASCRIVLIPRSAFPVVHLDSLKAQQPEKPIDFPLHTHFYNCLKEECAPKPQPQEKSTVEFCKHGIACGPMNKWCAPITGMHDPSGCNCTVTGDGTPCQCSCHKPQECEEGETCNHPHHIFTSSGCFHSTKPRPSKKIEELEIPKCVPEDYVVKGWIKEVAIKVNELVNAHNSHE